jgi:ribosome-binding protein aMBF1 (putative translation factor)
MPARRSVRRGPSPLGRDARKAANERRTASAEYAELEKKHELALAIADLVILHRSREGLTQEELASRMSTSVSAISRLESGFHVPSMETLRKFAGAIGKRVTIAIVDSTTQAAASTKKRAHAKI